MTAHKTLIGYIEAALRDNWEREALANIHGAAFPYKDVARKIAKLHLLMNLSGIRPGDKVAICGRNSAQWAVAALSVITYGAVGVPILNDFKPDTIHHLVNDCDARLLFTTDTQWTNLDGDHLTKLVGVINLEDFSLIYSRSKKLDKARATLNLRFGEKYPERFTPADVAYTRRDADSPALINYTSGSSGFSKGVIITHRNLWSNIQFCIDGLTFLKAGDGMVCMLPLAHMYGFVVEMLHPFVKGCNLHFLTKTPSPRVIMEAFAEVRPKLVVSVPLIIEKIIRTKVFPTLEKPMMKVLLHLPVVDAKVLEKVRTKLIDVFGGRLQEIIIGGAPLHKDVEAFLRRIRFPFTVGYGMTECAPLVAYAPWNVQRPGSCGRLAPRMQARIKSKNPAKTPGELQLKGDNVMAGYYHNDEATKAAFTADGWLNTGDLCTMDSDGFIYIRGRDKNMILGPSGQNIYPEEIEQKLSALPYVAECLIIDDGDGKLAALVYPEIETMAKLGMDEAAIRRQMADNIAALNRELPAYSQVKRLKVYQEEFEKTPKRSIKRYLYQQ